MNDYERIMQYYGITNQKRKLVEEMGELITAIARNDEENTIEEMADVCVLLNQFLTSYIGHEIQRIMNEKVARQLDRINNNESI